MLGSAPRYARRGDAQISYVVVGSGPALLVLGGTLSGTVAFEDPLSARFTRRLTRFAQVILVDPRGTGGSDPLVAGPQTVDEQAADVVAVLDDVGIDAAFVYAFHAGSGTAVVLAAGWPERVRGLVIASGWARLLIDSDQSFGITPEMSERLIEAHRESFGTGMFVDFFSPSRRDDPEVRSFYVNVERRGSSRAQATWLTTMAQRYDVRDRLGQVRAPTVVLHSNRAQAIPIEHGRSLSAGIDGAKLVEVAGTDHVIQFENPDALLAEIQLMVTGQRPARYADRRFGVIVFTDLVSSTSRAAEDGDTRWRERITRHDMALNDAAQREGGRIVKSTGDGVLAVFDVPSRALDFAQRAVAVGDEIGVAVRVGIHAGEYDEHDGDIFGLAVNLAARVVATADANEVIVTAAVRDLVEGSDHRFTDRGTFELKGFDGLRQLSLLKPIG